MKIIKVFDYMDAQFESITTLVKGFCVAACIHFS